MYRHFRDTTLAAAGAGDVIKVAVGTYSGGITVEKVGSDFVLTVSAVSGNTAVLDLGWTTIESDIVVGNGAIIRGDGMVGQLTLSAGGTLNPGASPGTISALNTTWAGGGTYGWEINQADGTAGANPGWDLLEVTGTLTITATTGSRFNVSLKTLHDNGAGIMDNFDPARSYTWTIAQASVPITTFDASKFNLIPDATLVALAGTFTIAMTPDSKSLYVTYTPGAHVNVLSLEPQSIYLQPGQPIVVDMNVAHLQQMVLACQAMLGYSSAFFADPTAAGCVAPGGAVWDYVIWDSWRNSTGVPGEIDTAIGIKAEIGGGGAAVGTQADGTVAKITLTAKTGIADGSTSISFRPNAIPDPGLTKSTFLSDMTLPQSQPVWPVKVNSVNIYVDGTPPVAAFTAKQNGANVMMGTPDAKVVTVGTVAIGVTASDALAGLASANPVTVVAGVATTPVVEGPAGTFTCTAAITGPAFNGSHLITVAVTDKAGNQTVLTGSIYVNISGQVELEGYVVGTPIDGKPNPMVTSRTVTFAATTADGTFLAEWDLPLSFSDGKAYYTLTAVPEGTAYLSAKTAWSLRRRLEVKYKDGLLVTVVNGLETDVDVDFTAANKLLGGDINGSNSINILDYSILRVNWFTTGLAADINGDGQVQLLDYLLIQGNWFKVGDPQ